MVGHHRPRNLLHRDKLHEFKQWLINDGRWIIKEPSGHKYEVLRFSEYTPQGDNHDLVIYQKERYQHCTLDEETEVLVRTYLKDKHVNEPVSRVLQFKRRDPVRS